MLVRPGRFVKVSVLLMAVLVAAVAWASTNTSNVGDSSDATSPAGAYVRKVVDHDFGEHARMSLKVMLMGESLSVEGKPGKFRVLGVHRVWDYGNVVTSHGMLLALADEASSQKYELTGGGADPNEAKHWAKQLLEQPTKYVEGEVEPRWRTYVQPSAGLTWGEVAEEADISVTWEQLVPKSKR